MVLLSSLKKDFFVEIGYKNKKTAICTLKDKKITGKSFKSRDELYWLLLYFLHKDTPKYFLNTQIDASKTYIILNDLCDDVLVTIFSFLDKKSLYNLGMVSKYLNKLSSQNICWQHFRHSHKEGELCKRSIVYSKNRYYRCHHELWSAQVRGICSKCQDDPYYTLITITTVKSKYKIKEIDFHCLPYLEMDNPYYKSASSMRLYYRRDIEVIAVKKHGDLGIFFELQQMKKDKRLKNRQKKIEVRKNCLILGLNEKGLQLRSDSVLCNDYIKVGSGNINNIVDEMCLIKYLYEYLPYSSIRDRVYQKFKDDDYFPYKGCISDTSREVALEMYGVPEAWPWLVSPNMDN